MLSAKNVTTLGTWSRFTSHIKQHEEANIVTENIKKTICLSRHVIKQATPHAILGWLAMVVWIIWPISRAFHGAW